MSGILIAVCVIDGCVVIGLAAIGIDMFRMRRRWRREDQR